MVEYQLEYSTNDGQAWVVFQAWAADQSEPLDTTALPDGVLLLRAKARDSVDLLEVGGAPLSVTVANGTVRTFTATAIGWAQGRTRTFRVGAVTYTASNDAELFYRLTATLTPAMALTGTLETALRLSGELS